MKANMIALAVALAILQVQAKPPKSMGASQQKSQAALQERATKFYELLVAGKARASEELVCEASKDEYYNAPKRHPKSAALEQAQIQPDGKTAVVRFLLEDDYAMPMGHGTTTMKVSTPSEWRLEKGQWCFSMAAAPAAKVSDAEKAQATVPRPQTIPGQPPGGVTMGAVVQMSHSVTASKEDFQLAANADGKDEIVITNGLNGPVRLVYSCRNKAGVVCKQDKEFIGQGQTAILTVEFKYTGEKLPEGLKATLFVEPFHRMMQFPIEVK